MLKFFYSKTSIIYSFIATLVFFQLTAESQPVIELNHSSKKIDLTTDYLIYEDKPSLLNLNDFIFGEADTLLSISTKNPPNKGYVNSSFWLKLNVKNQSAEKDNWYLEISYPLLDSVTLYYLSDSSKWEQIVVGDRVLFSTREINHRNIVFPLRLKESKLNQIYLKIKSEGSLTFPLTIWKDDEFRNFASDTQLLFGLYYGITISLILFNLFLFLSIKDRNYLFYILYISCYMFIQLAFNGLSYQYIWPDHPNWNAVAIPFLIGATLFTVLVFSESFLKVKEYSKKYHKYLTILKILSLCASVMPFLINYRTATESSAILAIIVSMSVFIAAIYVRKKGYRPAKYFLIAWTSLLIGIILYSLKNLGVIPVGFISNYFIQIGSALEVILLSLALADRINLLQFELEKNEKDKQKMVQEKYSLARQVSIGILHQVRQPLQVLKGYLDIIVLSSRSLERDIETYMSRIFGAVDKIDHLIKELEKVQNTDHFETIEYAQDEEMADFSGELEQSEKKEMPVL